MKPRIPYDRDLNERWVDSKTPIGDFWFEHLHVRAVEDEKWIALILESLFKKMNLGSYKVIDHDEDDKESTQEDCYMSENMLVTDVNNWQFPRGFDETVKRVRRFIEAGKPVIIISADTSNAASFQNLFPEAFESGKCIFLEKPFKELHLVMDAMKKLLPQCPRLSQEVRDKVSDIVS